MRKVKNFENGYVLISVLVIMIVMLVITFFLADALFSEVSIARNQKATTLSFNLAEAGVSEAIWRIQNDSGAKNTFLNSVDGQTIIPEKSLFANGSYSVIIQNTALGTATISSTGIYSFGLRSAQRKIVQNVAQATYPPPFPYDSAIFSSPAGGTSTGDLEFSTARLQIFGGSLLSGRDLLITQNSDISVEKTIQYTRSLIFKLSPPMLYELGLESAVEWLTEQIYEQHGIKCSFQDDEQPKPLSDEIRVLLFQVVRELLFNVVKHAQARVVGYFD